MNSGLKVVGVFVACAGLFLFVFYGVWEFYGVKPDGVAKIVDRVLLGEAPTRRVRMIQSRLRKPFNPCEGVKQKDDKAGTFYRVVRGGGGKDWYKRGACFYLIDNLGDRMGEIRWGRGVTYMEYWRKYDLLRPPVNFFYDRFMIYNFIWAPWLPLSLFAALTMFVVIVCNGALIADDPEEAGKRALEWGIGTMMLACLSLMFATWHGFYIIRGFYEFYEEKGAFIENVKRYFINGDGSTPFSVRGGGHEMLWHGDAFPDGWFVSGWHYFTFVFVGAYLVVNIPNVVRGFYYMFVPHPAVVAMQEGLETEGRAEVAKVGEILEELSQQPATDSEYSYKNRAVKAREQTEELGRKVDELKDRVAATEGRMRKKMDAVKAETELAKTVLAFERARRELEQVQEAAKKAGVTEEKY